MEKKIINLRFGVITAMILLAAMSRLIPHPANFAPIGGMILGDLVYTGIMFGIFELCLRRFPQLRLSSISVN